MSRDRPAIWRRARRAELVCALWLRLKGWRILARNLRLAGAEVDILARRGGTVAVVEVKQRPDTTAALRALGPAQRRRLARAGAAALARPDCRGADLRFDLMWTAGGRPRHLPDAWRPDADPVSGM